MTWPINGIDPIIHNQIIQWLIDWFMAHGTRLMAGASRLVAQGVLNLIQEIRFPPLHQAPPDQWPAAMVVEYLFNLCWTKAASILCIRCKNLYYSAIAFVAHPVVFGTLPHDPPLPPYPQPLSPYPSAATTCIPQDQTKSWTIPKRTTRNAWSNNCRSYGKPWTSIEPCWLGGLACPKPSVAK